MNSLILQLPGADVGRTRGRTAEPKELLSVGPAHYPPLLLTGVGKALTFLEGSFTTGVEE